MSLLSQWPTSSERYTGVPRLLSLRILVRLRWLAVLGQLAAVLYVHFALQFPLPLLACLSIIGISATLNIVLRMRWKASLRLTAPMAGILLAYDIVQLASLLYLTGGLENPFALLFLVPVTVSATSLPLNWTVALSVLALLCETALVWFHLPLPWFANSNFALPQLFVFGVWIAISSGMIFSSIYARRIAKESRQMAAALEMAEQTLAREQRFSALDGLAAAAAHELGTPLATIALVAKELKRDFPGTSGLSDDLDLLISQAARCRDILARLANRDAAPDDVYERVSLSAMLENLVAPLRGPDIALSIKLERLAGTTPEAEPVFKRNPAIVQGLSNLLENAVDFAEHHVTLTAQWSSKQVTIEIADDGPGFDPRIINRLGEPYITTRPGYEDDSETEAGQHAGMGLGLFIAKTLLERSGATAHLSNRIAPLHGAIIQVSWDRKTVDVGKIGGLQLPS